MKFSVNTPPSRDQFIQNMEIKMQDDEFIGDITALIRPVEAYDPYAAYELVRTELIERM